MKLHFKHVSTLLMSSSVENLGLLTFGIRFSHLIDIARCHNGLLTLPLLSLIFHICNNTLHSATLRKVSQVERVFCSLMSKLTLPLI